ncbi:MAG: TldD/PmbA family protein [Nitrospirae bacterium]|nr:TldD/PmbA family protein [Nitrospirota bacterium]
MMDPSRFRDIAKQVMALADGTAVEVLLATQKEGLTRFGNNVVTQHIETGNSELVIRVLQGKRQGKAGCNQFDRATLERTVRKAVLLASIQCDDSTLLPLPMSQEYRPLSHYVSDTPLVTPDEKIDLIRFAVGSCKKKKTSAAGIFSHGMQAVGLANSNGLFAYNAYTSAGFSVTVMAKDSSGWADATDPDIHAVHPEQLTAVALEKALAGRNPKALPPGQYDVILEPAAVAELLLFMAWDGFGALPYMEGRSFVSGKLGQKVLNDRVTITDDVYHPQTLGLNFDYEGMPRRCVVLVDHGVAKAVVHDRKTAKETGAESTGHALPLPNTNGPMPLNLVLAAGGSSVDEMVASTSRGLLITHFHYTNILDPVPLMITGMTRDGVFLVEKGKVKQPVKNFRFTESVVKAFNQIEALGRETAYAHAFWGGGIVCPAAKIRGFNFSSATRF